MDEPRHTLKVFKGENTLIPEKLDEAILGGPHADADWSKATVTVKVPINGTAETTVQELEVPLLTFAGLLAGAHGYRFVPDFSTWTKAQLIDLLGDENTPKYLADMASDEWQSRAGEPTP